MHRRVFLLESFFLRASPFGLVVTAEKFTNSDTVGEELLRQRAGKIVDDNVKNADIFEIF